MIVFCYSIFVMSLGNHCKTTIIVSLHPSCHSLWSRNVVTHWRDWISNEEVHRRTDQPPLRCIIHTTHLKFFGHIARADPSMDHCRVLRSSVAPIPRDWNCRSGRLYQTRLRTVVFDVSLFNIVLATAYHRAQNWQAWRSLVQMATSTGQAT